MNPLLMPKYYHISVLLKIDKTELSIALF